MDKGELLDIFGHFLRSVEHDNEVDVEESLYNCLQRLIKLINSPSTKTRLIRQLSEDADTGDLERRIFMGSCGPPSYWTEKNILNIYGKVERVLSLISFMDQNGGQGTPFNTQLHEDSREEVLRLLKNISTALTPAELEEFVDYTFLIKRRP